MAAKNGTLFTILLDGLLAQCETDSSLSLTKDMIETTCKASGSDKTFIAGEGGGSVDVGAVYDETGAIFDYSTAFAAWQAGALVPFKMGGTIVGEKTYSGNTLIADLSVESPQNDRVTWSMTLQVTGAITEEINV